MPQKAWSNKRERQVPAHRRERAGPGPLDEAGEGDRRAHGQQGAGSRGRGQDRRRAARRSDISSGRRGGKRSGTNRQKGRTRDQLYNEAKRATSRAARR